MNLCSLHFLRPCTDDWLPPCLIVSMYLDAFLEAFRVSDVTTLAFFSLGFRLLLLEFWCAPNFCVVLPDWCGVARVELCYCVYEWMNALLLAWNGLDELVLAWGVTFGLDWCILVWDDANWVAKLVLTWDGAPKVVKGKRRHGLVSPEATRH